MSRRIRQLRQIKLVQATMGEFPADYGRILQEPARGLAGLIGVLRAERDSRVSVTDCPPDRLRGLRTTADTIRDGVSHHAPGTAERIDDLRLYYSQQSHEFEHVTPSVDSPFEGDDVEILADSLMRMLQNRSIPLDKFPEFQVDNPGHWSHGDIMLSGVRQNKHMED